MIYLLGYCIGAFLVVLSLGIGFSALHRNSRFGSAGATKRQAPQLGPRAMVTFSIILPFTALAFLILTFTPMRIAQTQGQQGHLLFIFSTLFLPTGCFLIGFYYFKKAVGS